MRALFLLLLFFTTGCFGQSGEHQDQASEKGHTVLKPGAESLDEYLPLLQNKRVGILTNQTAVLGAQNTHLVDSLLSLNVDIVKIFGPEHGFRGDADAGAKVNNEVDEKTGIPIISLYGSHKKPTAEELEDVDIMLFDIQDVGTRFYTYINSMQYFLEAAAEHGKPILILDRPNPNGFYVDGPILEKEFESGVGKQPIPIVYGMTIGEYAQMLIGEKWLSDADYQPDLTIIKNKNYTHDSLYKLPVKPSPNLPNMASIYLYPSLCFFEGTPVNVGRGTEHQFQLFGHPDFPKDLYSFTPVSRPGALHPKLEGQTCYGYLVATEAEDARAKNGAKVNLEWIQKAYELYPQKEEFFKPFFHLLAGTKSLMEDIQDGKTEEEIRKGWEEDLLHFKKIREKYLLYPDFSNHD